MKFIKRWLSNFFDEKILTNDRVGWAHERITYLNELIIELQKSNAEMKLNTTQQFQIIIDLQKKNHELTSKLESLNRELGGYKGASTKLRNDFNKHAEEIDKCTKLAIHKINNKVYEWNQKVEKIKDVDNKLSVAEETIFRFDEKKKEVLTEMLFAKEKFIDALKIQAQANVQLMQRMAKNEQ